MSDAVIRLKSPPPPPVLKAPAHLKLPTKRWYLAVLTGYELEEHHRRLLLLAAEAWDRATDAREAVEKHGLTYDDRYGCPKPRPEVAIERDARIAFARLVRELDLDAGDSAPPEAPRPPMLKRFGGKG